MSKSIANPLSARKKGPKVVDHIRVHRSMDGGWHIEKHHTGYEHEPETKSFKAGEGDKAAAHLLRLAGMPGAGEEEGEAEHKG